VRTPPRRRRDRGFTLVELMVAITLGLFLMIGLISLIVSTVNARAELDKTSRRVDNGRYALELLSEDVQAAGFIGSTGGTAFNLVTPVACPANIPSLGYSGTASPTISSVPMPIYGPTTVPACINNVMPGTAMLVVTRVSTTALPPASATATETYLQMSTCASDTVPFAIASGASAATFTLMTKTCLASALAPVRKVIQHLYYVSTCNVCGTDSTPTLKMAEYVGGAMTITALAEGIENFQVDYGIDIDGNGAPDCYTSNPTSPPPAEIALAVCPQTSPPYDWTIGANNWGNVMALRIHLLARNIEPTSGWSDQKTYDMGMAVPVVGPFNDQIKRQAYSVVARLYNASGQRETP